MNQLKNKVFVSTNIFRKSFSDDEKVNSFFKFGVEFIHEHKLADNSMVTMDDKLSKIFDEYET